MPTVQSPVMNVMVKAARKAARFINRDFGEIEQLQVSRKGPADFVSAADLKVEEILHDELTRARPGYGFVMEEAGVIEGTDKTHRWIIDPIDGTTNFLHGIPHFAVSIALEREGHLQASLVYNPIADEMFWAERGQGAFVNDRQAKDRRIRVSGRTYLKDSLIATGIPFAGHPGADRFTSELVTLMPIVSGIRRFGSAALDLAYVAAGRFDGFWERNLNAWDVAAGILLVREAGGEVTSLTGADPLEGDLLATNGRLHREMLELLGRVNLD